jgi:hypothetical protein
MICLDARRGASGAGGISGSPRLTVIGLPRLIVSFGYRIAGFAGPVAV